MMMNKKKINLIELIDIYKTRTGKKMNINLLSKEILSPLNQKTVWNYLQRSVSKDDNLNKKELPMHIIQECARILGVSIYYDCPHCGRAYE